MTNTKTTTPESRSFERPVRPTHSEGLPIVAWRFTWDDGGDGCGSVHYSASHEFDDDDQPDEVAALVMATDAAHKIETLRALIGNDSHACTFQSLGQYRSALLAALSNA
jgi:hypothetical protein